MGRLALTLMLGVTLCASAQFEPPIGSESSEDDDALVSYGARLIWESGCLGWGQAVAVDQRLREGPIQTAQEMFYILGSDRGAWDCLRQMPGGWMAAVNADVQTSSGPRLVLRTRGRFDWSPADSSAQSSWLGAPWGQSARAIGYFERFQCGANWSRRPGEPVLSSPGGGPDLRGYVAWRFSGAVQGQLLLGRFTPRLGHGLVTWSPGAFDDLNGAVGVHRITGGIRGSLAVGGAWARQGAAVVWNAGPSKWTLGLSLKRRPMRTGQPEQLEPLDSVLFGTDSGGACEIEGWYADDARNTPLTATRDRRRVCELFIDSRRSTLLLSRRLVWGAGARIWTVPGWRSGWVAGARGAWSCGHLSLRLAAAAFPQGLKSAGSAVLSLGRGADLFARFEHNPPAGPERLLQLDGGPVPAAALERPGWSARWGVEWNGVTRGWVQWSAPRPVALRTDIDRWMIGNLPGTARLKIASGLWEVQASLSPERSVDGAPLWPGWCRLRARHNLEEPEAAVIGSIEALVVNAWNATPWQQPAWMAGLRWTLKTPFLMFRVEGYSGGGNPDAPPRYVPGFGGTVGRGLYGSDGLAAASLRARINRGASNSGTSTATLTWRYSSNGPRHGFRLKWEWRLQ
ncbi:MAG: hypothetical protein P8M07_01280 [Flavobacteriales bacterium]|nr:hypothetical protein [Flavobacteriales bacterium]